MAPKTPAKRKADDVPNTAAKAVKTGEDQAAKWKKAFLDNFQCAICLCLCEKITTLGCGHNFCRKCIETHAEDSGECPECRAEIADRLPAINAKIAAFIDQSIDDDTDEQTRRLHLAIVNDDLPRVKTLLKMGADPNAKEDGVTALELAVDEDVNKNKDKSSISYPLYRKVSFYKN